MMTPRRSREITTASSRRGPRYFAALGGISGRRADPRRMWQFTATSLRQFVRGVQIADVTYVQQIEAPVASVTRERPAIQRHVP